MKPTPQYEFTKEQDRVVHKARILEGVSLGYLISLAILIYLVMSTSQAMKTVWTEVALSIIPPISFLLGSYICWRKPTHRYPYGYHRVTSIAFLCSALALLTVGGYLLIESLMKLISQEHPTIGFVNFWGTQIWLGWLMIPVLLWGIFPPIFLGRAKIKLAEKIHDKVLYTDAKMNKADWLTASVALIGILGLRIGWWWTDALAATIVSISISYDGIRQIKIAITDLMDRSPKNLAGEYTDLPEKVIHALKKFPWVKEAEVRLREEGHLIFGEGFVTLKQESITAKEIEEATKKVEALDWKLRSFTLTILITLN